FAQEVCPEPRHGMIAVPDAREAHDDEAGERRRFQKAAALRLDALQDAQTATLRHAADQTRDRIERRAMGMDRLAQSDERRQGVADDRQLKETEPRLRKARKLERQTRDFAPLDQPGMRTGGEDRDGKRSVVPVAAPDAFSVIPNTGTALAIEVGDRTF